MRDELVRLDSVPVKLIAVTLGAAHGVRQLGAVHGAVGTAANELTERQVRQRVPAQAPDVEVELFWQSAVVAVAKVGPVRQVVSVRACKVPQVIVMQVPARRRALLSAQHARAQCQRDARHDYLIVRH